MRVIVTNDDGIAAAGIRALAARLVDEGHDVLVAAPATDRSGSGAGLGVSEDGANIEVTELTLPGRPDIQALAIDAPPAAIALALCAGGFGRVQPDVLVSGINEGFNTGRSTLHSGTLGAAATAASLGVPAMAISTGAPPNGRLDTAAALAVAVLHAVIARGAAAVSLNVPGLSLDRLAGAQAAGTRGQGLVDIRYERDDAGFRIRRISPGADDDLAEDAALVGRGFVSLSDIPVPGSQPAPLNEILAAILRRTSPPGPS